MLKFDVLVKSDALLVNFDTSNVANKAHILDVCLLSLLLGLHFVECVDDDASNDGQQNVNEEDLEQ